MIAVTTWLLSATLKGSLVIAMALLLRGRIASRWMHALLLIAIVRLLMPVAPESSFSIFNLAPQAELAAPPPVVLAAPSPIPPGETPLRVPFEAPAPQFDRMTIALLAAWATGCAFMLLRAAVRSRMLRRRLRDRAEVDLPLVDECREAIGVRRRVRAYETDAVITPSLHGFVRPMLLLPRGFVETFSHEQLRFVVLHELAHLRRSDVLVNWLTTFAQALHWFNPLVHLAAARIAEERELACDALALERLRDDERSAYGGTVLAVLDRMRQPSPAPGLVGMTATHRQLKRRIQMIAAFRPQRRSSLLFAALVATIAMVSLTDAVAGERVTFEHRIAEPLNPAAEATIRQLETNIDAQLTKATIHDVASLVTARTGVMVTFAEGALSANDATTFTVNAKNVPAHILLAETIDSLGLALHFQETGVMIDKLPEGAREPLRVLRAPGREPLIERAPAVGEGHRDVIFIERSKVADHRELPAPREGDVVLPRMQILDSGESAEDGVIRRRVSFRGGREGQTEGTLELEVHRDATSASR